MENKTKKQGSMNICTLRGEVNKSQNKIGWGDVDSSEGQNGPKFTIQLCLLPKDKWSYRD